MFSTHPLPNKIYILGTELCSGLGEQLCGEKTGHLYTPGLGLHN